MPRRPSSAGSIATRRRRKTTSVRAAKRKFGKDTKAAIRQSFNPREQLIPSEKLEGMTAQAIYSGIQLVKAKRASKAKKRSSPSTTTGRRRR